MTPLSIAGGEFVAHPEPGSWLAPRALVRIEQALAATPEADLLYTDEVVHRATGSAPFRKPDWSLERQRWQDCCGQLTVARRSLVDAVGGPDPTLGDAAQHDLVLRCAERARRIVHLPELLYHRRIEARPGDGLETEFRPASPVAVRQHLARTGVVADVAPRGAGCRVLRRDSGSTVSIVVPTAGVIRPVWGVDRPLVLDAVRSVLDVTDHPRFEVVVVVDPVTPVTVLEELRSLPIQLLDGAGPFDFAARCNAGVSASSGEHVVLLNDDVLVEDPGWLSAMVGYLAEPDVGAVGARLLRSDGTLQHAGILLNEHPRHIFDGFAADDPGPFGLLAVAREVSAVTAACLATPRALWDDLGGMSSDFAVAFNDVDYCLRAIRVGRRVVWTPDATLYHFESQTRRPDASPREVRVLRERWGDVLRADPFGNPGFEPGQAWWVERQRRGIVDLARRIVASGARS
jgi:GT2 family glycosyltransferase